MLGETLDGLPVIGEIKVPTDTSLFVALVQSLTYASELLTLHQVARLRKTYPEHFRPSGGQTAGEILLLVSADDRPRLEEETMRLAAALLGDPEGAVAKHARRISLVDVAFRTNSAPELTLRHSRESAYHTPIRSEVLPPGQNPSHGDRT